MLGAAGQRMLAYTEKVTAITPIEKADRLEAVHINGWVCVCGKGEFKEGDLGVFFEIDSKLPAVPPFNEMEFLVNKKYKIHSQRIRGQISQGLFMPLSAFDQDAEWLKSIKKSLNLGFDGTHCDLTEILGVTYAIEEDNKRKASPIDKYKRMAQQRPNLFKKSWARWMMKKNWGKHIMFFFFGRKRQKEKKNKFPIHFPYVQRSDEERCENIPYILEDKEPWIKTLKIDGTSSTYILERKKFKNEFYVCSRNVRQLDEKQSCFHEENVYWVNEHQYHIRDFLEAQLKEHPDWSYVCLQGESAGEGIQGNPHSLKGIQFFGFNFIDSKKGRWNSVKAAELCKKYNIPWVPILDTQYILPDTMEELKLSADGPCDLEGSTGLREGFVYRSQDGARSFKNVSREYLLKHHQ